MKSLTVKRSNRRRAPSCSSISKSTASSSPKALFACSFHTQLSKNTSLLAIWLNTIRIAYNSASTKRRSARGHRVIQFALELHADPEPVIQAMLERQDDAFCTGLRLIGRCIANGAKVGPQLREEVGNRLVAFWAHAPSPIKGNVWGG